MRREGVAHVRVEGQTFTVISDLIWQEGTPRVVLEWWEGLGVGPVPAIAVDLDSARTIASNRLARR